jgi:hypothetical protein
MQHRHANTLLKTLAEWIWTLEPDIQCCAAKGGWSSNLHFFALGAFLKAVFLRTSVLFFATRLQARKRGKGVGANLC